jgi:quercetin dioxygenase-like cupin family protein
MASRTPAFAEFRAPFPGMFHYNRPHLAMEIRKIRDLIHFSEEKMQKLPVFESPKYFCDLYCLRPGQDQRIHSHAESDKIYFILRGKGLFHIAGEEQELVEGQSVIARPGQDHGVKNSSAEDLVLLVFMTPRP